MVDNDKIINCPTALKHTHEYAYARTYIAQTYSYKIQINGPIGLFSNKSRKP